MRTFKQLTAYDRVRISRLKACGFSISEIASKLGKNKSSISRELRRNASISDVDDQLFWMAIDQGFDVLALQRDYKRLKYSFLKDEYNWTASDAERTRCIRANLANKIRCSKKKSTKNWVIEKLKSGWTPEQIAGRSKREAPEKISHEFVYAMIKKDRDNGGRLFRLLPRFRKRKQRFAAREYKEKIAGKVHLSKRPKVVARRSRLGDLEADLIHGYKQDGFILTVIDRKSRLVVLRKVNRKTSAVVARELVYATKKMCVAKTITTDNGLEFAKHVEISRKSKADFFFATPHSSCERGSVENMNGLIRRVYPKGKSFKAISQNDLNLLESKLNNRPRKILNFLTPREVHSKLLRRISSRCI